MKRFGIAPLAVACALVLLGLGAYAVGSITTDEASTAAPTTVNLSGVSAAAGSSFSFAKADHVHSITGALPAANVSKDATLAGTTTLGIDLTHANTWTGIETFTATASQGNPIVTPQTSAPSAPSDGAFYMFGTGTAMTLGTTINGTKQSVPTRGAKGGSAIQTVRASGCTTAASVGATCAVNITWPTAFPDTNYTVACTGEGATNVPVLGGGSGTAKTASVFQTFTVAITAAAASFSLVNCTGIHD